jgi:transposase
MSKESIREKIKDTKERLRLSLTSNNVNPELKGAIEALLLLVDIMIAIFLEKKIRKNSSNSGLPPSRNNGPNGNRNKGSGDRSKIGDQISNTKNTETEEKTTPNKCTSCLENLKSTSVTGTEERKKIDIVYEIITHTVVAEIKKCPECGKLNKGNFPHGMAGKIQYGNGIKATIINFLTVQMISLERVQEHFRGLIGRFISQAIMLKYIAQLSGSLREWEECQIAKILSAPVIYCDETSMRVDKANYWVHSYSYEDITLKFIHPRRGNEAINEINIIPRYGGIIVHDRWASYFSYKESRDALCGGHLLRDLKFVEESTKNKWATEMKQLLQQTAETISGRPKMRVLTTKEFACLRKEYRKILLAGKKELPLFPEKTGKRGRIKHTEAQNLWLVFKELEESVLMFTKIKEVDFTNNRAERDLRDSKLKQKVSGCFRKFEYAKHFCRISSYVKTMRYKGYSSLEAISLALQGNIGIFQDSWRFL